jgi:hypothetical protein
MYMARGACTGYSRTVFRMNKFSSYMFFSETPWTESREKAFGPYCGKMKCAGAYILLVLWTYESTYRRR